MEGIEGIKMRTTTLILLNSAGIFATHYSYRRSNGFQSFWPIGGFQQHISQAHFGVELHLNVFEERVRALQKTHSSLDESKMSP